MRPLKQCDLHSPLFITENVITCQSTSLRSLGKTKEKYQTEKGRSSPNDVMLNLNNGKIKTDIYKVIFIYQYAYMYIWGIWIFKLMILLSIIWLFKKIKLSLGKTREVRLKL